MYNNVLRNKMNEPGPPYDQGQNYLYTVHSYMYMNKNLFGRKPLVQLRLHVHDMVCYIWHRCCGRLVHRVAQTMETLYSSRSYRDHSTGEASA